MRLEEIRIRDPFILPYEGKYYLYGTGIPNSEDINIGRQFWCYVSTDLVEWSAPMLCFDAPDDFWGEKEFWAPEVHLYHGKFYMFATFFSEKRTRATQALVADQPEGPYRVFGEILTPEEWMSLDGTLYIQDGQPYLVFSHEWLQVEDGQIAVVPLKKDLSASLGEPTILFAASESGWAQRVQSGERTAVVTDGPYLVKEDDGLYMFWSSFHKDAYAVGIAVSENGRVEGPWKHISTPLFEKNGGHGMMFENFEGKKYFVMHQPDTAPEERACLFEIEKISRGYRLK